eukprot:gnl/TRDRNA2_/TRDRNA2_154941_c0_seq6.p2 gnl/TRDRNA2_/TRDRNA2_154941_c0~~gnl/TRDRNA2_/TRDRNA2_154941_c0_seq6.p2  ORF type:complete len:120 (-),score=5.04 gnl/TRDRNA2_/TRDRNA2_154941_c0_seq6:17-376(-)
MRWHVTAEFRERCSFAVVRCRTLCIALCVSHVKKCRQQLCLAILAKEHSMRRAACPDVPVANDDISSLMHRLSLCPCACLSFLSFCGPLAFCDVSIMDFDKVSLARVPIRTLTITSTAE